MSIITLPAVPETGDDTEPFQTLLSLSRKKTGSIPEEVLVRHVLSVTAEADWPVQRAAMEALLRRVAFAESDGLRVAARPTDGSVFGFYGTRRAGSDARPYATLLLGVSPPRGSCECADFLRGSLGLCKHLLVILDDVWASSRRRAQALRSQPSPELEPAMMWDPVRPLVGPGDALERVRVAPGRLSQDALHAARPLFRSDGDGLLVLKKRVRRGARAAPGPRRGPAAPAGDGAAAPGRLRRRARGAAACSRPNGRGFRVLDTTAASAPRVRQAVSELKQRLYPYQIEGVSRFLGAGRLLLADDMGLGKTVQAIAACHALFAKGKVRRGLLIVPAALKPQWLREWQLFSDAPVAVVDGPPAERRAAYRRTAPRLPHRQLRAGAARPRVDAPLAARHRGARRGAAHQELGDQDRGLRQAAPAALPAGAHRHADGEPPRRAGLDPRLGGRPRARAQVAARALARDVRRRRAGDRGARNLDTLRARLAPSMLRRVRSEVLDAAPPADRHASSRSR